MAKRTNLRVREPKIEYLTKAEVRRLLDRRARRTLGISGEEFLRRFRKGELRYTSEESALAMLAELVVP